MIDKKAAIFVLGDAGGPRIRRSFHTLVEMGFSVDLVADNVPKDLLPHNILYRNKACLKYSFFIRLKRFFLRKLWRFRGYFPGQVVDKVNDIGFCIDNLDSQIESKYDLIIVEDLYYLPLAFRKCGRSLVILDAREYYTREFEGNWHFDLIEKPARLSLCKRYLGRCDAVLTVSSGLVDQYRKEFNVHAKLFRSLPNYHGLQITKTNKNQIKLVHMGVANPDRQIEKMVEIAGKLKPNFTLDFFLVGNTEYVQHLKQLAADNNRVRFLEPVKFNEIIPTLNQYDLGFYHLVPKGFNTTFNLPNKLFEFIQARLAVIISPNPCMADVVHQYSCGFVSKDYESDSMVDLINQLTSEDIDWAKTNSDLAAKHLCFENEKTVLVNLISRLMNTKNKSGEMV